MATFHVKRKNLGVNPPRFEWLRNRPDFTLAGALLPDGVTMANEDTVTARWTYIESYAAGVPQWRGGNAPFDFGRNKAEKWAALIDGAKVDRFGDYEPPTFDLGADAARRRKAREEYAAALTNGGEPL